MREILRQNCADLLRDIERLGETLRQGASSVPAELAPFYRWVCEACEAYRGRAEENLRLLAIGLDDILPDVLSETQNLLLDFQLFNRRLIGPVLRARESDRLCLMLVGWLHGNHQQARKIPAALSDGDFASWPFPDWPAVYFMPPSAQHRLLYLPLFFHEFGHILYSCYKLSMDGLVEKLQKKVRQLLEPSAQLDDQVARRDEQKRRAISETWYEWMHELFCDAVGFVIGGPAFAYSFSMYFRLLGREEYHLRYEELVGREHPVTWLRMRVLADRARRMGYGDIADELEETWGRIAETMGVEEDYYGFYESKWLPDIQATIDSMLADAELGSFSSTEASATSADASGDLSVDLTTFSFILLLNQAWRKFLKDPASYAAWERRAINTLLTATAGPTPSVTSSHNSS